MHGPNHPHLGQSAFPCMGQSVYRPYAGEFTHPYQGQLTHPHMEQSVRRPCLGYIYISIPGTCMYRLHISLYGAVNISATGTGTHLQPHMGQSIARL